MDKFEHEIIKVLIEAGDKGLSLQKIALHVYNACNSFFDSYTHDEVYALVAKYLLNSTAKTPSYVQRVSRGVYVFNRNTIDGRQLLFDFSYEEHIEDLPSDHDGTTQDIFPSLFDCG